MGTDISFVIERKCKNCYIVIMFQFMAVCALGLEKVLGNEIKKAGWSIIESDSGRVFFQGPENVIYSGNLRLRTCDRIFLVPARFKARDFDQLFEGIRAVDWQDYFKKNTRIVIDKVRINYSKLNSQKAVQKVAHKAVYDKLCNLWGMNSLPESGEKCDIRLHLEKDVVTVLLDLSGAPLNRRGYRKDGGEAPIRETLAAALILLMNWKRKIPLHDPFCGSGTFAAEAALYACNAAPGLGRSFGFENLAVFNKDLYKEEWIKAASEIRTDCLYRITGSDISQEAVLRSRLNVEHAMVTAGRALQAIGSDNRLPRPEFIQSDFRDLQAPFEQGMIITNPPYGERLGDREEAIKLYEDMQCLKTNFKGWALGLITLQEDFPVYFGKKEEKKRQVKDGNLETFFFKYNNLG